MQEEFIRLKKREKILGEVAKILRVDDHQVINTIKRFLKDIRRL